MVKSSSASRPRVEKPVSSRSCWGQNYYLRQILGGLGNAIIAIDVTWELPRSEETLVLLLRLHESSESRGEDCERGW